MTTHSNVKKKYNENLCMDCGCSWEDGDEIPECVPSPKQSHAVQRDIVAVNTRGKTRKVFYHPDAPEMKAFKVTRASVAVLVYGTSKQSALAVVRNWTREDDILEVEFVQTCNVLCQCPERIPYIEMASPQLKRAEELTGTPFVSPSTFRASKQYRK